MSEAPPPLPPLEKKSAKPYWLMWIGGAALIPAVCGLGAGTLKGGLDNPLFFLLPVLTVFASSIMLGVGLAKVQRMGAAAAVALSLAFIVGGFAVSMGCFFAGCLTGGASPNFH